MGRDDQLVRGITHPYHIKHGCIVVHVISAHIWGMSVIADVRAVHCEIDIGICSDRRPMLVGIRQNEVYQDLSTCKLQRYRQILHLWGIRRGCPCPSVCQGSIWLDRAT